MKELIEKAKTYFQPYIEQGKIHTIEHNFSFDVIELVYRDEEHYCIIGFCPEDIFFSWVYKENDVISHLLTKSKNDIEEIPTQFQQLVQEVQQDLYKFNEEHTLLIQQFKSKS